MKHLDEAELIEHYYEESANMAECERHLKACPACAKRYAELRRVLDGVKPLPRHRCAAKTTSNKFGNPFDASLPVYEKPKRSWMRYWRPLGWAAACALLLAVAFVAGRRWERKQTSSVAVAVDPQARQRVVIVFLGDHLDRSERSWSSSIMRMATIFRLCRCAARPENCWPATAWSDRARCRPATSMWKPRSTVWNVC